MSPGDILFSQVFMPLMVAMLVGLSVRGRAELCWSFAAYVALTLGCNFLTTTWPSTFWNLDFYTTKELAYAVLKMAIAFEIGERTLRGFSTGWRRTATWFLVVLVSIAW